MQKHMKQSRSSVFLQWWLHYLSYIQKAILRTQKDEGDVSYWRELSFVKIVAYLIPVSLVAFIPRIIAGFFTQQLFLPLFDILFYIVLCAGLLNKYISVPAKKVFVVFMLYIFSLVLLLVQGAAGPGILYLSCTCIFTVFLFKGNQIYLTFLVNVILVAAITLLIYFAPFPLALLKDFTTLSWLSYASNLLFINLICLLLIQRIIRRLEKIIIKESELQGQLADEVLERKALHNKLQESEDYYRYLFSSNPIPMWVYDTTTLAFLQVNDAAVKHYGYSRDEFLQMNLVDIHIPDDTDNLLKIMADNRQIPLAFRAISAHVKKNKKTFPVEIRSNPIEVNGKVARLVLATDITERTRYVNDIEDQNKRLKHIAWIQSHKVRAPLARVMSLTDLLSRELPEADKTEVLHYLIISTNELNEIVTDIIKKAEAE
jgi:PAS domain S-box-containing protein